MSSGGGGGGNKSPGKGGKSLEIMQQKMMQQQQQQQQAQPPPATAAAAPSVQQQQAAAAAASRPKGKDFANMQRPAAPPPAPAVATMPPPQQQQRAPQQQQQQTTTTAAAGGGKPKGKDFSAMASRMTTSAEARQRANQAGARAFAGYQAPPAATPPPVAAAQPPRAATTATPMMHQSNRGGRTRRRGSLANTNTKPTQQPVAPEGRVAAPHMASVAGPRVQDVLRSLDPAWSLQPEAEQQVLSVLDDFLDKVTRQSIRMASHRGSKVLDVADVQRVLATGWKIVIPGLGPPAPPHVKLPSKSGTKRKASESATTTSSNKASKPTEASTPKDTTGTGR